MKFINIVTFPFFFLTFHSFCKTVKTEFLLSVPSNNRKLFMPNVRGDVRGKIIIMISGTSRPETAGTWIAWVPGATLLVFLAIWCQLKLQITTRNRETMFHRPAIHHNDSHAGVWALTENRKSKLREYPSAEYYPLLANLIRRHHFIHFDDLNGKK